MSSCEGFRRFDYSLGVIEESVSVAPAANVDPLTTAKSASDSFVKAASAPASIASHMWSDDLIGWISPEATPAVSPVAGFDCAFPRMDITSGQLGGVRRSSS